MENSTKPYILASLVLLMAQFFLWNGVGSYWSGTRSIKPDFEVVPKVPSQEMLKAFAFGDDEIAFRFNGYKLQFAGDGFGRVTALKDYDYSKLYQWWKILDDINYKSDLIPYYVAYYWSASQKPKRDVPYVVDFLEEHSDKDPSKNWWWYSQAAYNARFKMNKINRALEIAQKLADLPKSLKIPLWTRQLGAFLYEKKGEYQKSCEIILHILEDYDQKQISEGEINFMFYFVQERLRKMVEDEGSQAVQNLTPECKVLMDQQKAADLRELSKNKK